MAKPTRLAAVLCALLMLCGCHTDTAEIGSDTSDTVTTTTSSASATTTVAMSTTTSATTTVATTTTSARTTAKTTTTTAAMTTVTLKDNDPDRDYGTPTIATPFDEQAAQDVLVLVNKARAEAGLAPLTMDEGAMMDAAKTRAKEITAVFDHYRPNGDAFFSVFQQFNVEYRMAGENLAAGQPTAAIVFESWWNSETHRANMMNEHFTHISIAATSYKGEPFWVQLFRK